ncbi:hypothetical protein [Proteus sp. NMG38-2]|uniref:hypothetical protein n=1 Tax=Proteus sp. NMG38-2 TaxID=2883107 RepID=UPI001D0B15EA|nr:hypothetical protein [Proteus sp. NMG38-2]UDN35185.1 hypothetical protein LG402_15785 [Proteus sp. NMG38-2]
MKKQLTFHQGKYNHMNKKELMYLINEITNALNELKKSKGEDNLDSILILYKKALLSLESGKLKNNIVKNMTRGYLEIYSDYDNPVLKLMYQCEKEIILYLLASNQQ